MCIFCKIIAGEIPCSKIYEDENSLAFLDIKPVNPGHTLVITKKHYQDIEEIPAEELAALITSVKRVGELIKSKLKVEAYNILENNGPSAGQIIPHLHFHVVPRYPDDGLSLWPSRNFEKEDFERIKNKLLS